MLAQLLGMPSATGVLGTEISDGVMQVERELEGGALEVVKLKMPCVASVQTGANQVRYASLKGIMQAKKKPVDVKTAADLGVADQLAAKATIVKIAPPVKGATAEILQGSTDEVAGQLLGKIKELGLL
jgi:electron transfer flavoprotein beta subunit